MSINPIRNFCLVFRSPQKLLSNANPVRNEISNGIKKAGSMPAYHSIILPHEPSGVFLIFATYEYPVVPTDAPVLW